MASRIVPIMDKVQSAIGYRFKNVQFLWEALQVPGTTIRSSEMNDVGTFTDIYGISEFQNTNKRLAIVGDAVLKTALLEDWYHTGHSRGLIAPVLKEIASNYNLNIVGRTHQLDTLMLSTRRDTVELQSQYVADTVEAILGAAYLDDGMTSVQKLMSNLGLESKALHQAKFTEDGQSLRKRTAFPTSQHSPASRIIQSARELQLSVDNVLHLATFSQGQNASVDPQGILHNARASASQCLKLLISCRDILLQSATLKLRITVIDIMNSAHEVRTLILTWEKHLKLRLWRREHGLWRSERNFQRALRCIKSSCEDLTGVLPDILFVDTGSGMMIEYQVAQNYESSFMRLASSAHSGFPISVLAGKKLLTILQRRIGDAMRSGRRVQGMVISLRGLRSALSITSQRVQSPAGFLPRPTKEQAIRNSQKSFQRVAYLVGKLQSDMDVTPGTRLTSLRTAFKYVVESGRQVQSLTNFLQEFYKRNAILKSEKSIKQVVDPAKKLRV